MILTIRGTSGSGKSTIVRDIMDCYDYKEPIFREGRRRPIGYKMTMGDETTHLFVPGHYETPCGGCDTITKLDDVFKLVRQASDQGDNVLYEGLLVSAENIRTGALIEEGYDLKIFRLTTPIPLCLSGVNARRQERLKERYTPVNPRNTKLKDRAVTNSCNKMEKMGAEVNWLSREDSYYRIRERLFEGSLTRGIIS